MFCIICEPFAIHLKYICYYLCTHEPQGSNGQKTINKQTKKRLVHEKNDDKL